MKSIENIAIIILAAGMGTRMKSSKAKVLHEILGVPMITYILASAEKIAGNNIVVVIGHQAEKVREVVSQKYDVKFALQDKQLGTGHAVSCALPHISEHIETVMILCGDVPLIVPETISQLASEHILQKRDISLLAIEMDDPSGYGRVIFDESTGVSQIVEDADATPSQKHIKIINTGIYSVKKKVLAHLLRQIKSDNAQDEFYLTDIVGIGYSEGLHIGMSLGKNAEEVIGVNSPGELEQVEKIMKKRLR